MTDEYDVVYLDNDDVNEVVQWATGTAALLVSLELDLDEIKEAFPDDPWNAVEAFVGTLQMMQDAMPDILNGPAIAIANNAIEEVAEEEAAVETFVKEIEEFNENGHTGLSD